MMKEKQKKGYKQIAIITTMLVISVVMLGAGVWVALPHAGHEAQVGLPQIEVATASILGRHQTSCTRPDGSDINWNVSNQPATCTANGGREGTSNRCGNGMSQTFQALGHADGSWHTTATATCTTAGSRDMRCTRFSACGNVRRTEAITALGHSWGAWSRTLNPTCTAAGNDRRTCGRDSSHVENSSVAALSHDGGTWTRVTNPTCTANGSDRNNCNRCSAQTSTRAVAALGHIQGPWTIVTHPTCTTVGYDTIRCTRTTQGCSLSILNERWPTALGHDRFDCRHSYSFIPSGSIVGTRPGYSNVTAGTWAVTAVADRHNRPLPPAGHVYHYQGITITITLSDQGFLYLTNQDITNRTSRVGGHNPAGVGGTLSPVTGTVASTRTFTITNVQSNITAITVDTLPIQIFNVTYPRGSPPHTQAGTINQTDFASAIKVWGLPFRLNTNKYTVSTNNWEHVGWTTSTAVADRILTHRNFANSGAMSATRFAPNGITSWGSSTGVIDVNMQTINWSSDQMNIPGMQNAAHVLHPVWAPVRTELQYVLGTAPPSSGNITPTSLPTGIRLTSQEFTFPSVADVYTVDTGAVWKQIGWNLGGSAKYLAPLADLPEIDFAPSSLFPTTHTEAFTNWGITREIHPTWRRIITDGKVNIISVGGPCVHPCPDPQGCFMHVGLANIGVSAKMPFEVAGSTINHEGTSTQITLPSFNEMTTLGEENGLTFQGWYIRTTWALATQRIDNTATPNARVVIPWQDGVFAPLWEPYIWVEAWWG